MLCFWRVHVGRNNKYGGHFCVCLSKLVTRKRQNITFYSISLVMFCSGKYLCLYGGSHVFIATGTLAVMTRFADFPQSFQENDKMVPRLGHVHFLQKYLEYSFTNHPNITLFVFEDFYGFPFCSLTANIRLRFEVCRHT